MNKSSNFIILGIQLIHLLYIRQLFSKNQPVSWWWWVRICTSASFQVIYILKEALRN